MLRSWISLIALLGLLAAVPVLADVKFATFESDADNPFKGAATDIIRVDRNASEGKYSLLLAIKGSTEDSWPGLSFSPEKSVDWFAYHALKMDVFVDGNKPVTLGVRLDTKEGTGWLYSLATLQPGWNKNWTVPINDVRETADLHNITSMWLGASNPREDANIYFDNVRLGPFDYGFKKIVYLETSPGIKPNSSETKRGFMVFNTSYSEFVFPNAKPKSRMSKASMFLAQGEKEPLVVNVHAVKDLESLAVSVSTLQGPNGAQIKPADWNIGIVRHRDKRENYQVDSYIVDVPTFITVPNKSENLESGKTASFWLTLSSKQSTSPGVYTGYVSVSSGSVVTKIPVQVRVLPFVLPELTGDLHGVYYRPFGKGMATREQIRFDIADMKAHGMTSLGLCIGIDSSSYKVEGENVVFDFKGDTPFEYIMDAYIENGFTEPIVMLSDTGQEAARKHPYASDSYARTYISFWKGLDDVCVKKGWKRMYIQPEDEVGWRTAADRERNTYLLGLLKKAGLMTEVDGPSDSYFNNEAGPLSDVWNYNGILGPADVVKAAIANGKLVTVYNFDSSGYTPETQRWARGLFNWKHGLRGSFNWEYRGGNGSIFDDQDARLGDWVHYYPSYEGKPGGPSTGWEGSREGLDDRKYIRLLENLIDTASKQQKTIAAQAQNVSSKLQFIKRQISNHPDSTVNRITWTEKLMPLDALKAGHVNKTDPEVSWYYTGALKMPNGLQIKTSDDIRWFAATEIVKLLNAMGKAEAIPQPISKKTKLVQKRLVSVEKSDRGKTSGAKRPTSAIPNLATAPQLDGVYDTDAGWKNAAKVDLTLSNGNGKPQGETQVLFGINGSIFYVCFVCGEDRLDDILARVTEKGGPVWEDDCVEVFIDGESSGKSFHQVVSNSLGNVYTIGPEGVDWNADVRASGKVDKANRRWILEMAIPLDAIKLSPSIGLNFARERRPLNILELSSWSVTGDSFRKPERFGIGYLEGVSSLNVEEIKPELSIMADPIVSPADSKSVSFVIEPKLSERDKAQSTVNVFVKGNGKSFRFRIEKPLKDHIRANIDVSDLPQGEYAVFGAIESGGKKIASCQTSLLRIFEK